MQLSFHGANRKVTGSCTLIKSGGKKVLVDCGLHQGGHEAEDENLKPFGFDPAQIDFVVLTHAHLDHCGRLPLLQKMGFKGEIICTSATRELARLILLNSAHLQEEEARYQERKAERHGHNTDYQPLYNLVDTLSCFDRFGRTAHYEEPIELAPGIRITFFDARHILGSASVLFELEEEQIKKRVLFAGDIGTKNPPLLNPPKPPADVDVVVMETTYGDRLHKPLEPSVQELCDAINSTFERGGNVIIPTFALERAQELLHYIRMGIEQRVLPANMQVFLDSPMAISATEIFRKHVRSFSPRTQHLFQGGRDPFSFKGLHFVKDSADSMALNRIKAGAVIMAGSGMCNGGRIRHHLKHNLWRSECSVVFVGFAVEGSLARRVIDGAEHVRLFREEIPVRAAIHTINGFSAHADQQELLNWHAKTGKPSQTFLIHGEENAMNIFASKLRDTQIHMPHLHTEFRI